MKKLIPTILLLLPVAGHTELVPNDFVVNELPAPSVSTADFNLVALPNRSIYQGTTYNCSLEGKSWKCMFSTKRSEKILFHPGFGHSFTHIGYRCNTPNVFEAQVGFSLGRGRTILAIGVGTAGSTPISPGNLTDLYVDYLYLIGRTGGSAGASAECLIYGGTASQPYTSPIGKFVIGSDYGSNGHVFGVNITPATITLKGSPDWSGAVRITGAGYAGRLMIQSDRDIRINLGQGWSNSGRSFETRLMSGDKVLSYAGQMKVAGEVQTSGTTTYTVQVTHVVE